MIICHGAILHYNMSFKTIAGRSDGVFWWYPALYEDQEKNCWIHQIYLVALICLSHILQCISRMWNKAPHLRNFNFQEMFFGPWISVEAWRKNLGAHATFVQLFAFVFITCEQHMAYILFQCSILSVSRLVRKELMCKSLFCLTSFLPQIHLMNY